LHKNKLHLLLLLLIFWPVLKASSQKYFQQEVNYNIQVNLNDKKHELNGYETIEYINNSPDTLHFLYFHLWPDGYSNNKTSLANEIFSREGKSKLFNDPELKGFIDSIDFKAEGKQLEWSSSQGFPDICKLTINKPLYPGDTISINTPFHVKIPKGVTSRLGHTGESYQISQWYPKPAVYDRNGWHAMPYLDQGEFYSEYGNFDVSITLPSNYIVGATGNLQNEEEKKALDILSTDISWKNRTDAGQEDFPPSSKQMKTLHYTENNIHDFAWFADKRFHVLKGIVKLPETGRLITTYAMFTNQEAQLWKDAISYINYAIWYFSKWTGDYPYESFTAVQSALTSGAGMEYPGLTVIGLAKDSYLLDEVLAHEICHSWFYSALGSDERRFPYMDEGLATSYEARYMEERYPFKMLWELSLRNRKIAKFLDISKMPAQRIQELEWIVPARKNLEQPLNLAAADYTYENYGSLIYNKAGQGFNYLRSYLGDSLFDSTMHDYYNQWKNKHPHPEDLRMVFESHTNKDLSWFFDDFLETTKRLDYKVVRIKDQKLLVRNKGEINAPLLLAGKEKGSILSEKWIDGFNGSKWIDLQDNSYTELQIDPEHRTTELFRLNNNIRTSGIFRKNDPVKLQLLYTVEDPDKRYLIYLPAFDWNSNDGFMAGVAVHNGTLIPKPFEYFLIPFYTFRKKELTGYGKISFNIIPYNNIVRLAVFSLEGSQFGAPGNQNYHRTRIGYDFFLRSGKITDQISQKIFIYHISASDINQIKLLSKARMLSYLQFGYRMEKGGIIDPYSLVISFESGKSFQKTSLELNFKHSYNGKGNGLEMRFFAGTMLRNHSADAVYSFSAGGRSGRQQYLYQGLFPDRFGEINKTFWSRQMDLSEGALATPVTDSLGYSPWVSSLSFTSSLPGKMSRIPVKPFTNIVLNSNSYLANGRLQVYFETGIKTGIRDFFEVYIPVIVSGNLSSVNGTIKERIRFVFRLDKLNPLKY
jgi:hypothetical protein